MITQPVSLWVPAYLLASIAILLPGMQESLSSVSQLPSSVALTIDALIQLRADNDEIPE